MKLSRPGRVAIINLSIAAVLIVALVVGFVLLRGGGTEATASSQRTATVSTGDVTATVSATGTSEPTSTSEVSFTSTGTITSIKVTVGSTVKKGQVLATLDADALQTQVDVAQAKLDAAQDQYSAAVQSYDDAVAAENAASSDTSNSSNTNVANGSSSNSQNGAASSVSSASAQLASARANQLQAQNDLDTAQQALDGATLRSPRAGTVLTVNGTVGGSSGGNGSSGNGSTDTSSSGLFTIADLARMQVSASFAEADAMQLKVGQAATTVFNAAAETPVTGKVTTVAPTPTTSNNVVSYAVTISLPTLPKGLRSGQTATVTVTTGSASNVLTVPGSAITSAGGTHTVTVVANGKSTRTPIEIGLEGDQLTQVTSGLSAGQTVLLTTATSTSGGSGSFPGGNFPGGGLGGGLVTNGNGPAGGGK
ncbi:efflux RND transporter periplasmic adaptor subunit [Angustibacter sp. McL0619]|uniref:efflux RND transporter periplasmic adaptor subunit n=1 Tax=Angustibacter sp. McL0619 TaxID=3415676 RepID=UPI003CF990A5